MRGVVSFGFALAVGAMAGVLGTSQVALASWVSTGDYVSVSAPLAGGRGGPFLATNKTTGTTFQTLCIEWSEVVKPGRTYYATVDEKAYFGGGGAVNGADPLSMETSYLYKSYVRGTLDGVVIGSGGTAWKFNSLKDLDLRALQDAVWWFEQERAWTDISARSRQLVTWVNALAPSVKASANDVRVMNLWTSQASAYTMDGRAQSMLTLVPEPASLVVWLGVSSWFVGAFIVRRRRAILDHK